MSGENSRVVVITGAGSGIGRAAALAFARLGDRLVAADVDVSGGQETVRQIEQQGGTATFIRTDISRPDEVEAMVQHAVQTYGRLDCAFNNAGIGGAGALTADYAVEDWNRVIAINLSGTFLCMKYELAQMLAQGEGQGNIVNNASILGLVGYRTAPAYVASKHGVLGLTQTAALEYAQRGIRVNAVCPGFIHTPMVDTGLAGHPEIEAQLAAAHPMGRLGTPEEVAGAVVWLCSEGATFVTGQAITMDGGYVAQ